MNRSFLTTIAMLGLVVVAATATAGGDSPELKGKSMVGAHYTDVSGHFDKVGEYFSDANAEEFQAHAFFSVDGASEHTLFDVYGFYRDRETKFFGLDLWTDSRVSASFDYQSFVHHLDHDLLQNLQAREGLPDDDDEDDLPQPGGKQVYHHDMDPMGRYWINYAKLGSEVAYDLETIDNGKIYVRYDDQHKTGWKQTLTIDHCATCHVEGNRREINEQTRTWVAGAEGTMGGLTFNLEYQAQDFTDYTEANQRTWTRAQHPARGGLWTNPDNGSVSNYVVEFGRRLGFHDVTLPYAAGASTEKRGHEFALKYDVNDKNLVKGSYSSSRVENIGNSLSSDFDAFAAGWVARPNKKTRITARALMYEIKADDVAVDLLPYRYDRPGGNQDFDWTRISAASREVLQTDLAMRFRLGKGSNLNLDWRHKTVDRPAMNQTQTSYYYDAVADANVMVASAAIANMTTTDRFRATWQKRFGKKGNARVQYAYTTVQKPFMNVHGMCEEEMYGTNHTLDGNPFTYYFQRERVGNGTSLPNKSHRVAARTSYRFSPRVALNAYLNVADEKNDALNSYSFERTVLSPGANLWIAPDDKLMITMGYTFNSVESNALFCPPLFGG